MCNKEESCRHILPENQKLNTQELVNKRFKNTKPEIAINKGNDKL
jgi:hypothetical protein